MILSMINMNAIILAGGRSSRMGVGSKALIRLGDKILLEHVIQRLQPQVDDLAVNGDAQLLTNVGCPIIEDKVAKFSGPLA